MSVTKSKEVFIDFTKEPEFPNFSKAGAIATAADNQEDYCWVGGNKYIEWIQTGQNDALMWEAQTTAPFGWLVPLDNLDSDGIEITMGMAASSSAGTLSFTVGTDAAFYCRVKAVITTLANQDVFSVGFRELGAYTDITTPALMGSVYDEKAGISVDDNAGAVVSHFSLANADTQTTATNTPIVTAQAFEFMVQVTAAGVCSYYIALDSATTPLSSSSSADTLLAAATTQTLATDTVLVPYIAAVATGAGAPAIVLQEWQVGYVANIQ